MRASYQELTVKCEAMEETLQVPEAKLASQLSATAVQLRQLQLEHESLVAEHSKQVELQRHGETTIANLQADLHELRSENSTLRDSIENQDRSIDVIEKLTTANLELAQLQEKYSVLLAQQHNINDKDVPTTADLTAIQAENQRLKAHVTVLEEYRRRTVSIEEQVLLLYSV